MSDDDSIRESRMVHVDTTKSVIPPPPAEAEDVEAQPKPKHRARRSTVAAVKKKKKDGLASILPDFARTDLLPDFAVTAVNEGLKIPRLDRLFKMLLDFEARHHVRRRPVFSLIFINLCRFVGL